MNGTKRLGLAAAALMMAPLGAQAFQLDDHAAITRQAVEEFNLCAGNLIGADLAKDVAASNRNEDINLFRKWSSYSHFFHPRKTLSDMRRLDSSLRIAEVEHAVEQLLARRVPAVKEAFSELGHAIHHLQDAGSPPHVVPVMHGLGDKFEGQKLSVDDFPGFDLDGARCDRFKAAAAKDSPLRILEETAVATLQLLKTPFRAHRAGVPVELTWEAFWKESDGAAFGDYGFLGNSFGKAAIEAGGATYGIDPATYRELNRRQLRIAVDATRRAFHWIVAKDWGK